MARRTVVVTPPSQGRDVAPPGVVRARRHRPQQLPPPRCAQGGGASWRRRLGGALALAPTPPLPLLRRRGATRMCASRPASALLLCDRKLRPAPRYMGARAARSRTQTLREPGDCRQATTCQLVACSSPRSLRVRGLVAGERPGEARAVCACCLRPLAGGDRADRWRRCSPCGEGVRLRPPRRRLQQRHRRRRRRSPPLAARRGVDVVGSAGGPEALPGRRVHSV
eukprot:scaffold1031_cov461-Prasinococcus_capsulatus_cf.AAC.16